MNNKIKIFGESIIDPKAIEQLKRCAIEEEDILVMTADGHYGYGHPVGGADEAPGAYKPLMEVLEAHKATTEIVHRLTPIGVAMAGFDEFDPYKD